MNPFAYPERPHVRRHGPRGYAHYESYREWLRDEFSFRCIFCLNREQWVVAKGAFAIDHFVPASVDPEKVTDYDNLLYTELFSNSEAILGGTHCNFEGCGVFGNARCSH